MAGVAGVRKLGPCARVRLPPPGQRRTDLFHGAPRKMHRGGVLGGSSSSLRNLTLLTGAADSTEEDGRGRGHGASSLQNPPRVAGHPCDGDEAATETRKVEAREGDIRQKAGQSTY
jgi:hypothetical protein